MRIIGLTGGIASGKSTVSKALHSMGAIILDADKVAWQLAEPDQPIWQAYFDRYGEAVINEDRSLNRQAVADRVFSDKSELAWMNGMAHPIIHAELMRQLDFWRKQETESIPAKEKISELVIVLDIPLLLESGWADMADEVWVVYVEKETQIQRLMERNSVDREEAVRRINSQMSMEEKRKKADFVIDNNGSLDKLMSQVNNLWNERCHV